MNQIEWCQVRLDITHEIQLPGDPSYPEIQVTQRSKLPGDPALGNLPGDPALGNLQGDLALGNLPGDLALGNWIVLKPSTYRHNCFAEN